MSSFAQNLMGKLFSKRKKPAGPERLHTAPTIVGAGDEEFQIGPSGMESLSPLHTDAVVSVGCIEPTLCVSGSKDMSIILFDYVNKRVQDIWKGHLAAVTKVHYDAVTDAVFSSSRDRTVKMWKRGVDHPVKDFKGHALVVTAVDVDAGHRLVCTGSRDNTVKLWDLETAVCLKSHSIAQNLVTDLKFFPDPTYFVQTGEDKEVRVFDVRSLHPVFSFPKKHHIQMCCDISQDGNYIISSSNGISGNGCEATLWDMRQRKSQIEYKGHYEACEACLFLPTMDGQSPLVVTASRDCSVRIFERDSAVLQTSCYLSASGPLTSLSANDTGSIFVGSFSQGVQVLQHQDKSLAKLFHY